MFSHLNEPSFTHTPLSQVQNAKDPSGQRHMKTGRGPRKEKDRADKGAIKCLLGLIVTRGESFEDWNFVLILVQRNCFNCRWKLL